MMSPTQLDSPKLWAFAAQDLTLSASRIFSPHFPLLFIFCPMKISQSSNHCILFLSARSFDQRGKLKHYIFMVLREVFQPLEWCMRHCVGSIPPQPQVENESQELPFLSQLLSLNRIRSQCQWKQLQATQTNLHFFFPKSAIQISSNTGLLANLSPLEKPCATEVSGEWENQWTGENFSLLTLSVP